MKNGKLGSMWTGSRDTTIDLLRGVAIFVMVAANMAGALLMGPHPFLFRFYGTFAAPLFIFLAGMMTAYTSRTRKHSSGYYFRRGGLILVIAMAIDVVFWEIYPLMGMDVLYLIALALPLTALSLRLPAGVRCLLTAAVFLMTPWVQLVLGYRDMPSQVMIVDAQGWQAALAERVWRSWIVDGWFPVFPWLGFAFLGALAAELRWGQPALGRFFGRVGLLFAGFSALAFGGLTWFFFPGVLLTRDGYSELFYPPTIGYCLTAIGVITTAFCVFDLRPVQKAFRFLMLFGECSLLMYIFHLALIALIFSPLMGKQPFGVFTLAYVIAILVLLGIAYAVRRVKVRYTRMPFLVKFVLGA